MAEAQRQKWYYDWKIGTVGLKPGDLILVKADAFQMEEEDQGQMGGQASWGSMSDCDRQSPHAWSERPAWKFTCPTSQLAPPHCIRSWHSLVHGCLPSMGQMYQPHPSQAYSRGSDSKTVPQEDNGLAITQCQARKTSLGWINGKLQLLPWMSAGASTEDGWRFQAMCSGHGCLPWQNGWQAHMCLVEG